MKEYKTAELSDIELLKKAAFSNDLYANNYSALNCFLYRNKFASEVAVENGWIFERFEKNGKKCFSFPHNLNGDKSLVKDMLFQIQKEARNESEPLILLNITEQEKDILLQVFPTAVIEESRNTEDYIYLSEKLSSLSGKKLSRKRNHLHQFFKLHEEISFEALNESNVQTVIELEGKWLKEAELSVNDESFLKDLYDEKSMIEEAVLNFRFLSKAAGLSGGIVYAGKVPFAFCLASALSTEVTDIHFEKCLSDFARDGGYAVINNEEAKNVSTKYINREEDLGIEGLRKAKLSYFPEIILPKYNAVVD